MSERQHENANGTPQQRAEVVVDQLAERLGHLFNTVSLQVRKAAARTREEAEDIWAEAQAIRRHE